jgi:uncharacterized protein
MIFIDTGAYLARYLARDQYHRAAAKLWLRLRTEKAPIFTSNFVLDETATLLARRSSPRFAAVRLRCIFASSELRILRPTPDTEIAALDLLEKYADQNVSFTDCISFALMREAGIKTAFSFDQHFVRAGFDLWQ